MVSKWVAKLLVSRPKPATPTNLFHQKLSLRMAKNRPNLKANWQLVSEVFVTMPRRVREIARDAETVVVGRVVISLQPHVITPLPRTGNPVVSFLFLSCTRSFSLMLITFVINS